MDDRSGRVSDEVEANPGGVLEEVGGEGVLVEQNGAALKFQVGVSVGSLGEIRLFN